MSIRYQGGVWLVAVWCPLLFVFGGWVDSLLNYTQTVFFIRFGSSSKANDNIKRGKTRNEPNPPENRSGAESFTFQKDVVAMWRNQNQAKLSTKRIRRNRSSLPACDKRNKTHTLYPSNQQHNLAAVRLTLALFPHRKTERGEEIIPLFCVLIKIMTRRFGR